MAYQLKKKAWILFLYYEPPGTATPHLILSHSKYNGVEPSDQRQATGIFMWEEKNLSNYVI